ncbi:hypothetical protein FACS1894211_08060 [Clostridia bacterium]|nr:hypothetical protein FACS1894211_08060 [Clostridia bacterium]
MKVTDKITKVTAFLLSLKFNPKAKGFQYIRQAVLLVAESGNGVYSLKRDVYPKLVSLFQTGAQNLERDMSNCIEAAFLNAGIDDIERVFGNTINAKSGKPTVKEFIAAAAIHIIGNG